MLTATRWSFRIAIGLLLGVLSSARALGQSITAGAVSGIAVDEAGAPVPGAMVALREVRTGLTWTHEVRVAGEFAFTFLSPGEYELFAEQVGYRPTRVVDIQVVPGADMRIRVRLASAAPPVSTVDTARYGAGPLANGPGAEQAIRGFAVSRLPLTVADATEAARLSSQLGHDLGAEGLSNRGTLIAVDGIRHDLARHPDLAGASFFGVALPHGPLSRLDVVTAPLDAEWTDFAGAAVNAMTRSGSRRVAVQAFGDGTASPLAGSSSFDPAALDYQSWRGGVIVAAPVIADTAYVIAGVEVQRDQHPAPPAWIAGSQDALFASASEALGAGLGWVLQPRVVRDDRVTGFMRLDWQLAEGHRVIGSAAVGFGERTEPDVGALGITSPGAVLEASDVLAGASVTSRLSGTVAHELRFGFERSERDYGAEELPAAYLATGERFGMDAALPARLRRTGARVEDVLHLRIGSHRLKAGLTASFASHDHAYSHGRGGAYWFTDASGLALGRGVFLGATGPPAAAGFSVPRFGALLQDRWTVIPGLELVTALRYDLEFLPRNEIALNQDWFRKAGLANPLIPTNVDGWSSRLGFVWRIGDAAWLLRGGAGIYRDVVDPAVLGELITESGSTVVRQGLGDVSGWPNAPSDALTTELGARLSLLGPRYEPPRSTKVSFGLARRLGRTGSFSVAANYRHTDYLIRRHDLNRLPGEAGRDQYGRSLYGSLVKEGSLVAAQAGSNRRFTGFEMVSALDPDGFSEYRALTVALQQPVGRFLRVQASYTFSDTRDNWLSGWGGGPPAQLSPFPDSLNGQEWDDGRSDFDLPHRAAVGMELWPFGRRGLSLAARYAVRSGRPFTPGFRPGVDANGDGSPVNDAAFVDETLPGMDLLLGQWPCLRRQIGRFAERNSCREPGFQSLDLRMGLGPARLVGLPIEVWVEALNVTDEIVALRDHALQLVEPAAPLNLDPATGGVTVPLVVNSRFGQPLAYRAAGRFIRFGLRVGY